MIVPLRQVFVLFASRDEFNLAGCLKRKARLDFVVGAKCRCFAHQFPNDMSAKCQCLCTCSVSGKPNDVQRGGNVSGLIVCQTLQNVSR